MVSYSAVMSDSSGKESGSHEPPPLGTVRRLRRDQFDMPSAAAEDDWYETERLTGQITGRMRGATAVDAPAPQPTPVLDWRHTEPSRAPTAAQRVRRNLERRRGPRVPGSWLRRGRQNTATPREGEPSFASSDPDESAAARPENEVAHAPALGLRHGYPEATPARSLRARINGRELTTFASGRAASAAALAVAAIATAAIGIASAVGGGVTKPRPSPPIASTSAAAPGFAAKAQGQATVFGIVEHHVRVRASEAGGVPANRTRRAARHHSRPASNRSPVGADQSTAPGTTSPAQSTGSYGTSSTSPTYSGSGSSSSPGYGGSTPPPSAPTARPASHTQTTQPAFGANGSLAPGRGAAGTQ